MFGISKETARGWYRQTKVDARQREGTSEELTEVKRLQAGNQRLRQDLGSTHRELAEPGRDL